MKFIPAEKMSKKQKAKENSKRRTTWDFSPITRVKPSKKVYKREKVNYENT